MEPRDRTADAARLPQFTFRVSYPTECRQMYTLAYLPLRVLSPSFVHIESSGAEKMWSTVAHQFAEHSGENRIHAEFALTAVTVELADSEPSLMRGLILILTILFKILIHLIFVLQECQAPGHATTANAYQPTRVSAYLTIKHLRGLTVLPFQVQRLPVTSLPPSAEPSHRHLAVTISPTCCVTRKTGIIASRGYLRQY